MGLLLGEGAGDGQADAGLSAIFRRFPTLRLAADPSTLEFRDLPDSGVVRLPVSR